LCRKFYYDEESGAPVKDRDGSYRLRRDKTPCEASIGCLKGHWKDSPDLKPREERILRLWWSSRGTMGRSLTDDQLSDRWLVGLLGELTQSYEEAVRMANSRDLQQAITIVSRVAKQWTV
jgi:hypothetical protein